MVNSAQLLERNFFASVEHPELAGTGLKPHTYKYPGAPYKFSRSSWNIKRAPLIGEHNAQVYQEKLGLSIGDLERLSASKVI
jgi:crotonobetainyl-CoA:carnitine CoA-transferase CaiB-like acyl-CoA transferase